MKRTMSKRYRGILMTAGFLLVVYGLFPVEPVNQYVRKALRDRLPEFVRLHDLRFQSPLDLQVTPGFRFETLQLRVPMDLGLRVGSDGLALRIRDRGSGRLDGRWFPLQDRMVLQWKDFPISTFLPNQEGATTGNLTVTNTQPLQGEFRLSLHTGTVKRRDWIPRFFWGDAFRRVHLRGSVKGQRIQVSRLRVRSRLVRLRGTVDIRFGDSLRQSWVHFRGTVEEPYQRRIQRKVSLARLRRLASM